MCAFHMFPSFPRNHAANRLLLPSYHCVLATPSDSWHCGHSSIREPFWRYVMTSSIFQDKDPTENDGESRNWGGFFLDSVNLLLTTKQELITSIYLQIIFKADRTFLFPLLQPVSASYYPYQVYGYCSAPLHMPFLLGNPIWLKHTAVTWHLSIFVLTDCHFRENLQGQPPWREAQWQQMYSQLQQPTRTVSTVAFGTVEAT